MPGTSGWKKLLKSGSVGFTPSLDGLRRKLTKGLEVRVDRAEARRGDEIDAVVVVSEPERLGEIEVSLVCTEYYDEETHSSSEGGSTRTTSTAVAYESWQPVPGLQGEHGVRLTIPADAPFSYDGDCLSFRWEVVACGRKNRGLDARASQKIGVRP
jgi:hypothetical protein